MPHPPVRVLFADQHAGQGLVGLAATVTARGPIDRRAHQRMPQPQLAVLDAEQPRLFDRVQCLVTGAQGSGRLTDRRNVPGVVGRRHQQPCLRGIGQAAVPVQEGALDSSGQRQVAGQPGGAGQLLRRECPAQFDQCQRVAARAAHQFSGHLAWNGDAGPLRQQLGCVSLADPGQRELGNVSTVKTPFVAVAGGEQQRHPLRTQASRDKEQCRRGHLVEPLRIIHDRQYRTVFGSLREQTQRGEENQEPVNTIGCDFPEGCLQCLGLRLGQPVAVLHDRAQQPVQCRERQRRFGLDPLGPQHQHALRSGDGILEQRGFSHPGQAAHDQGTTM